MITWLADVLRAAGLQVVEHPGWKTRAVAGSWSPQYGVVHATAGPRTQSDATQVALVRDGHSTLDGPIANACVDRAGRWHVLAAGRCNTTIIGTAGPFRGQGNTTALGIEACNDNVSEPWPNVQYEAYHRGWAAICHELGWSESNLVGHKEHTPGHKTDPTFDMGAFRTRVKEDLAMAEIAGFAYATQEQANDVWRRTGSIQRTLANVSVMLAASATREAAMVAALDKMAESGTSVDTAAIVQAVNEAGDATSAIVRGLLEEVDQLQLQLQDRDARLAAALNGGAG